MRRQYQDGDSAWKVHFMIKRCLFYITIALIVGFVSTAFKPVPSKNNQWLYFGNGANGLYEFPSKKSTDYINLGLPFTGKFFIGFKEAIGFKESQGKYHKVNTLGYLGKYQFGKETLETIGIENTAHFINNPKLQEKAFVTLLAKNKWELREEIEHYEGKIVGGVLITESGILAAAHLGGAGSVKRFLKSNGAKKCKDAYGTSVKSYLKEFGGYETEGIVANKDASL